MQTANNNIESNDINNAVAEYDGNDVDVEYAGDLQDPDVNANGNMVAVVVDDEGNAINFDDAILIFDVDDDIEFGHNVINDIMNSVFMNIIENDAVINVILATINTSGDIPYPDLIAAVSSNANVLGAIIDSLAH